jgi:hypothetical protein
VRPNGSKWHPKVKKCAKRLPSSTSRLPRALKTLKKRLGKTCLSKGTGSAFKERPFIKDGFSSYMNGRTGEGVRSTSHKSQQILKYSTSRLKNLHIYAYIYIYIYIYIYVEREREGDLKTN